MPTSVAWGESSSHQQLAKEMNKKNRDVVWSQHGNAPQADADEQPVSLVLEPTSEKTTSSINPSINDLIGVHIGSTQGSSSLDTFTTAPGPISWA